MRVSEIIEMSAKLLAENDLIGLINYCEINQMPVENMLGLISQTAVEGEEDYIAPPPTLNEQSVKNMILILDCINMIASEVEREYAPVYFKENITVENGLFDIDNLSHKLIKIKKILKSGFKVSFEIINGKLSLPSGSYEITYSYSGMEAGFEDEVFGHDGKLSLNTFCYGVCSQYSLIKGNRSEAEVWEEKFKNSLQNCFRGLGEIRMPKRRWL